MATRPAWTIKDGIVVREDFEFAWNGGFAVTQKQKNIHALHQAINAAKGEAALEISSKSTVPIGQGLSAFSLKLSGVFLENVFQAAKEYEAGGPYTDLLEVQPKEAKRDPRHGSSGDLVAFVREGEIWPLEPKTAFYDHIYIKAVIEKYGYDLDLHSYRWFTDIEFNPKRSINCQARSAVIYKFLMEMQAYDVVEDMRAWITFHKTYVKG